MGPVREGNIYVSELGQLYYTTKSADSGIVRCINIRENVYRLKYVSMLQTYTLVGTPYDESGSTSR